MARPNIIQEAYNIIIKEIINRGTIEGYRLIEIVRRSISKVDLRDTELAEILETNVANNPNVCITLENNGEYLVYIWCGPNIEVTEK